MRLRVGCSGWNYKDWRGPVYPETLPERAWLAHYSELFDTVEINNSFYHLPTEHAVQSWHDTAPEGFTFAPKVSRFLTHIKRLKDPEEPVETFMQRMRLLRPHLGPVLLQLPPSLELSLDRLGETLSLFPPRQRVAVEVRHSSWFVDDFRRLLERQSAALVLTDRGGRRPEPEWQTAPWGYVRLHQGLAAKTAYGEQALESWSERIDSVLGGCSEVFVYFNNDHAASAVRNALRFREITGAATRRRAG